MGCIVCGGAMKADEKAYLRRCLDQFHQLGIERYVYRMETGGAWMVTRKESFEVLFPKIKKNFKKGAEYFHIQEYTG